MIGTEQLTKSDYTPVRVKPHSKSGFRMPRGKYRHQLPSQMTVLSFLPLRKQHRRSIAPVIGGLGSSNFEFSMRSTYWQTGRWDCRAAPDCPGDKRSAPSALPEINSKPMATARQIPDTAEWKSATIFRAGSLMARAGSYRAASAQMYGSENVHESPIC